jgi:hypothetical protein
MKVPSDDGRNFLIGRGSGRVGQDGLAVDLPVESTVVTLDDLEERNDVDTCRRGGEDSRWLILKK